LSVRTSITFYVLTYELNNKGKMGFTSRLFRSKNRWVKILNLIEGLNKLEVLLGSNLLFMLSLLLFLLLLSAIFSVVNILQSVELDHWIAVSSDGSLLQNKMLEIIFGFTQTQVSK
jgi:hypothetical protein